MTRRRAAIRTLDVRVLSSQDLWRFCGGRIRGRIKLARGGPHAGGASHDRRWVCRRREMGRTAFRESRPLRHKFASHCRAMTSVVQLPVCARFAHRGSRWGSLRTFPGIEGSLAATSTSEKFPFSSAARPGTSITVRMGRYVASASDTTARKPRGAPPSCPGSAALRESRGNSWRRDTVLR